MEEKKKLWFRANRSIGYGWTPSSWEGWIFIIFVFITVGLVAYYDVIDPLLPFPNSKDPEHFPTIFIAIFPTIMILTFIVIYLKGEKSAWPWNR
jgi:hypothetical protein